VDGSGRHPWTILHAAAAVLVCLVIPSLSWLDGSGWLAWTMYARSASYRVRAAAEDERGIRRWIAPTAIAARSERDLRIALAGSESWRHGPQGPRLRSRLLLLTRFACALSKARRVDVTLEERKNLDAPVRMTSVHRECTKAD
jgi:hypothetical protein